jgi:hypothetical protein
METIRKGVLLLLFSLYTLIERCIMLSFSDVMNVIQNYGFSGSTAPNYTDPIIIHLRFYSNNQKMYSNLANIFKSYDSVMLGSQYSFENDGLNLGRQPLLSFKNKILLIVDKTNNSFIQNQEFLEYVNLIKLLDLEIAGDFILWASTLMHIKVRMLLPREVDEKGEEIGLKLGIKKDKIFKTGWWVRPEMYDENLQSSNFKLMPIS